MTDMPSTIDQSSASGNGNAPLNPMLIIGAIVIIGVVGIGIFASQAKKSQPASVDEEKTDVVMDKKIAPTDSTTGEETTMDTTGVRTITVEAGSFYYKPAEIRVKKGQKVKIVMNSVDMMHDFNIDELGVKLPITKSGETNTVEFTPDKVGQFEYYCSVGQHRKNGQVGTLIVEE